TLVISSVGYPTKELAINGKTQFSITLEAGADDLNQVIVVGYGTQRKRDVTGSTVSVKGETLNEIKAPNIFNQLQGRAAGVDIVNNSTQIGAAGQIRIRGNRSI
ncbi:SusC/RagA family TonB-linked outer membrane protein, partial [Flavihumibacter sediminis]|nr:SusC/RagA family TonB-linked outer membrane protein [Flavihumibacter sediminis]